MGPAGALEEELTLAEEGVDFCLTGTKFDPAIWGERSGRLTVEGGDCRDRFVRDGKIPGGHCTVQGHERWPLVGLSLIHI